MNSTPRVSIAIATYNRCHLLPMTLDSLLAQTESDFEMILSDDHSTDDTQGVCERYVTADRRVRYVRNDERLGLSRNCTQVLRMAQGEFVILAGDDDVYEPDYLQKLLAIMAPDPAIALAACRVDMIDQSGRFLRNPNQDYFRKASHSSLTSGNRMLWNGFGNLMTGLYRRQHLVRTALFQSVYRDYWDHVDVVFLFDLSLAGDIVFTDEVLLHKRAGGVSGQPVHRSFIASVITLVAALPAHLRRLWRSDAGLWTRVLLSVSIVLRMVGGFWQAKYAMVYSLLVSLDPTGHWRARIRQRLPQRILQMLERGA